MPFFNVNFGLDDGYAHIIENSEAFPDYFSKVILKLKIYFNYSPEEGLSLWYTKCVFSSKDLTYFDNKLRINYIKH